MSRVVEKSGKPEISFQLDVLEIPPANVNAIVNITGVIAEVLSDPKSFESDFVPNWFDEEDDSVPELLPLVLRFRYLGLSVCKASAFRCEASPDGYNVTVDEYDLEILAADVYELYIRFIEDNPYAEVTIYFHECPDAIIIVKVRHAYEF